MEAHFFRHLAVEVGTSLEGRRIEKIHAPAENVWTIRFDGRETARNLLFRPAKTAGLLFFCEQKPANPLAPPARVMWLRKRIKGRRILSWHVDWPGLRLALELTPTQRPDAGHHLVFDLRRGLRLEGALDEAFDAQPDWPAFEDILDSPQIWKTFPHISPPLRKRLAALDREDAQALYRQVTAGKHPARFHSPDEGDGPGQPLVWPSPGPNVSFQNALEAAAAWGARTLFSDLEDLAERPEALQLRRKRKKLRKALDRLDQERDRLDRLMSLRRHGEALQANLFRLTDYDPQTRRLPERMVLEHPKFGTVEVELDPALGPSENMERFFRLADKGGRGLEHLVRRRAELGRELARLEAGGPEPPSCMDTEAERAQRPGPLPKRWKGLAVHLFTTDDGLTVARGKNKKANHEMLSRAASAFDFWFHAAHGPSSHVILKRDHPDQTVPERSLLQAAALCALKSSGKADSRVEVMFALVKDVRKVKGWAHGQVAVDAVQGTLPVFPDPELETRLARKG